ncbi:uncharacterized protein LOC116160087 [Photinus pyralis]|uniref:uncharacterized protein LOC116160087 n=1 Tax=Photinus pyralis TaxID=7054 RepID=UPI001267169A|nr:uncharacterized protein LOC116160087 [Photinus pyralis]
MLWHALVGLIWLMTYLHSNVHCKKSNIEKLIENRHLHLNLAKVADFNDIVELDHKVPSITKSSVTTSRHGHEAKTTMIRTPKPHKSIERQLTLAENDAHPRAYEKCEDLLTKIVEYEKLKTKLLELTVAFKRKCQGDQYDDFVDKLVKGCLASLDAPLNKRPCTTDREYFKKEQPPSSVEILPLHANGDSESLQSTSSPLENPMRSYNFVPVIERTFQSRRYPLKHGPQNRKDAHLKDRGPLLNSRTPHFTPRSLRKRSSYVGPNRGHFTYDQLRNKKDIANLHAGRKPNTNLRKLSSAKNKHYRNRISRKCCTDKEEEFITDSRRLLQYLEELEDYLLHNKTTNAQQEGKESHVVPAQLGATPLKEHFPRHCNSEGDIIAVHQMLLDKIRDLNNTINSLPHHESAGTSVPDGFSTSESDDAIILLIPKTDAPSPRNVLIQPAEPKREVAKEMDYERIERDVEAAHQDDYDYAYDDYYNEFNYNSAAASSRRPKNVTPTKCTSKTHPHKKSKSESSTLSIANKTVTASQHTTCNDPMKSIEQSLFGNTSSIVTESPELSFEDHLLTPPTISSNGSVPNVQIPMIVSIESLNQSYLITVDTQSTTEINFLTETASDRDKILRLERDLNVVNQLERILDKIRRDRRSGNKDVDATQRTVAYRASGLRGNKLNKRFLMCKKRKKEKKRKTKKKKIWKKLFGRSDGHFLN